MLTDRLFARELPRNASAPFASCFHRYLTRWTQPSLALAAIRPASSSTSRSPTAGKGSRRPTTTKDNIDELTLKHMFIVPSFEVYGGVSGLYDLGPLGTALQSNIVDAWRKHFVVEEGMLEVDCSILTPSAVLKASGHADRFADWMCRDPKKSGTFFRADHFVRDALESRLKISKRSVLPRIQSPESNDSLQSPELDGGGPGKNDQVEDQRDPVTLDDTDRSEYKEDLALDEATRNEYNEVLARLHSYNGEQLAELILKFDLRLPGTGRRPTTPELFNLMFQTSIGSNSAHKNAFLRPETAQGQFLNFNRLLRFNQNNMPFASASVGKSFRNEISPRGGLLRVREFLMAEIEHFVDPATGKAHRRFDEVQEIELDLLDRHTQQAGETTPRSMSIGQAVADGIVENETLGYFLARIKLFLEKIGIDMRKLRFRQHMTNEMAHYASDCWDAEVLTSAGWVECVGCADRSAYDLTLHSQCSGQLLAAIEHYSTPDIVQGWEVTIQGKLFGPLFLKNAGTIRAALLNSTQECRESWAKDLETTGKFTISHPQHGEVNITRDLVSIHLETRKVRHREYMPNVIEPSFGIGRILQALIEHVYWDRRGDGQRRVFSFPMAVAPIKVVILDWCLSTSSSHVARLSKKLRAAHIPTQVDESGAQIGKKYVRQDERGIPLAVTVDPQTVEDGTMTLRDRDTGKQVRADEERIFRAIKEMAECEKTWEDIESELPAYVYEKRE